MLIIIYIIYELVLEKVNTKKKRFSYRLKSGVSKGGKKVINKTILMEKIWAEGSEYARKKMEKDKFLIQSYAYACMEELLEKLKGDKMENV